MTKTTREWKGVKSKHLNLQEGITVLDNGESPRIDSVKLIHAFLDLSCLVGAEPDMSIEVIPHMAVSLNHRVKDAKWRHKFSSIVSRLIDIEKGR